MLRSGVRGWSKAEEEGMYGFTHKNGTLPLDFKDKQGILLFNKQKQILKQKVIKNKVMEFKI
ncbi:MAG: hypothetical protein O3C61_04115 [Proteobacteria bacterium]|nr:hypothetical protein [Pseudomonadota bacterium]